MPAPAHVLDLFAVPGPGEPVPGGQGHSVRAGDLVLSPDRDPQVSAWLNPVLARLAVRLDERPGRRPRDIRIAMPVPARNGEWVVDGWGASRYEPGTTACRDVEVLVATGRVLHAELDSVVRRRPDVLAGAPTAGRRRSRLVFEHPDRIPATVALVRRLVDELTDATSAPTSWCTPTWPATCCSTLGGRRS